MPIDHRASLKLLKSSFKISPRPTERRSDRPLVELKIGEAK